MKNIRELEMECVSEEERNALAKWLMMMLNLRKHINIRERYENEGRDEV